MTFRIAQISDTHLSGEKPFFAANFECVARAVSAATPDLIINTGDISLNGAGDERDLESALVRHRLFEQAVRFIPGNHDVGDSPEVPNSHEHAINAARRDAYLRRFGSDWWSVDAPGWRLLGTNAQLFGSGLAPEAEQLEFIEQTASSAGARALALFIHKPLFDRDDGEDVLGGRFLPPASRRRLWQAFGERRPALIANGHVHQFRSIKTAGMHSVWAPSAAYFIPDTRQPRYGVKQVGFVMHELRADGGHESRLVRPPGVVDLSIADFPAAYGPMN